MLKPNAVLTVFAPPKCRKLSESRLARAEHKAIVAENWVRKTGSNKAEFLEPVTTQDVGIRCSKIN